MMRFMSIGFKACEVYLGSGSIARDIFDMTCVCLNFGGDGQGGSLNLGIGSSSGVEPDETLKKVRI